MIPLFEHLVSKACNLKDLDESTMKALEAQFCQVHDQLLDYFVTAIENLCLEWLNTDAGIAWIEYLEKKKYDTGRHI